MNVSHTYGEVNFEDPPSVAAAPVTAAAEDPLPFTNLTGSYLLVYREPDWMERREDRQSRIVIIIKTVFYSLLTLIGFTLLWILALSMLGGGELRIGLPVDFGENFNIPQDAHFPPALDSDQCRFFAEGGEAFCLPGAKIPNPYWLDDDEFFNKELIAGGGTNGENAFKETI